MQRMFHIPIIILNTLSFLNTLTPTVSAQNNNEHTTPPGLTFKQFIGTLGSESIEEFNFESDEEISFMWSEATKFEWERAFHEEETNDKRYPFLVCVEEVDDETAAITGKGVSRRKDLYEQGINQTYVMTVLHTESLSCFLVYCKASWAADLVPPPRLEKKIGVFVQPVSFGMKLLEGAVSSIQKHMQKMSDFIAEKKSSSSSYEHSFLIMDVMLCPGAKVDNNGDLTEEMMRDIVLELAKEGVKDAIFWSQPTGQSNERSQFWDVIMKGIDALDCDAVYDQVPFSFESFPFSETGENITTLSMDFTDLMNFTMQVEGSEWNIMKAVGKTKICAYTLILALSLTPETCRVQPRLEFVTLNTIAQWLVATGVENVNPWYDAGLNGEGEVVAISDTGVDMNNCYFLEPNLENYVFGEAPTLDLNHRKIVQYDPFINNFDMDYGHGTHVVGSVCGNPKGMTGMARGVAFNAKCAFLDIGFANGDLQPPGTAHLLNTGRPNAKIHSASWGSTFNGYGLTSWQMDTYLNLFDDFSIMVAAGNDGNGNKPNTVGDPATAKNVIAVGASNSYGDDLGFGMLGPSYIADFSSRGPTMDGRTKPDIIAPGSYVLSAGGILSKFGECDPSDRPGIAEGTDGVVSMQGTSMSTPITSATAAMIRQYFREGFYPSGERNSADAITSPSGALIKAVLLNGAQNMQGVDTGNRVTNVKPYDNNQNFGRISLVDSLYLKGKSNVQAQIWDRQESVDGETKSYTVTIDTSGGCTNTVFSATLVWTDAPGVPGCVHCLINDLDLTVTKNNEATIYFPNGLSSPDRRNNAERVRIANVQNGDFFTINVEAYNLMTDQNFALIATGCFGGSGNSIDMSQSVYLHDSSATTRKVVVLLGIFIPLGVLVVCCVLIYLQRKKRYPGTMY